MAVAEPTWKLFAHLSIEIPLLLLYMLAIIACLLTSSKSSFYSFIAFIGIVDIFTYLVMLFSFRLNLYAPFNHFFNTFGEDDMTIVTCIYAGTWTLCCIRELGTTALALNRFTTHVYNNEIGEEENAMTELSRPETEEVPKKSQKWSMSSFVLTVMLCIVGGFVCNWYMWDREATYLRIGMDNGTHFFFLIPDIFYKEWLNEAAVTLTWSLALYAFSMGTYMLIAFHIVIGGTHPDVDRKEYERTKIAFAMQIFNVIFLLFNIAGYLLYDLNDFLNALKLVQDGAPVYPIGHDFRSLCVPILLVLFDSSIRGRLVQQACFFLFAMLAGLSETRTQEMRIHITLIQ